MNNSTLYSAINIGPIIATFAMARKPRELWAASYMFSHLMRCIYGQIEKYNEGRTDAEKLTIISPDKPEQEKNKIGIYPDRLFFKGCLKGTSILENAKKAFCDSTKISDTSFRQYFNVMSATCGANKDSEAIAHLNQLLDVLELCNYAADYDKEESIRRLITKTNNSPLFALETGNKNAFPYDINTLAEIATKQLRDKNETKWLEIRDNARNEERAAEKKRKETNIKPQASESDNPDNSISINEDFFYNGLSGVDEFKAMLKSHHKYFCVVQADGDNVGKTVSHTDLQDGQVQKISKALVQFGQNAAKTIEDFGGLPIYAGGDDLLFIAPVIGKDGKNIFDLLNSIETNDFKGVVEAVAECGKNKDGLYDDKGKLIEASLSFGISISYYKYPLYEAFEKARNLLFDTAKEVKQKKALAWSFRKHSGGTFEAAFSLKDNLFANAFDNLIKTTNENTVVSAVAHKIRENEALVKTVLNAEKDIPYLNKDKEVNERPRLDALFNKVLEFKDDEYFKAIKTIMPLLFNTVEEEKFISTLYSLLRTAKFIKGEDLHDAE